MVDVAKEVDELVSDVYDHVLRYVRSRPLMIESENK